MCLGAWVRLPAYHIGRATFTITPKPLGDFPVINRVTYVDESGRRATRTYGASIAIHTGNAVATISISSRAAGPGGSVIRHIVR